MTKELTNKLDEIVEAQKKVTAARVYNCTCDGFAIQIGECGCGWKEKLETAKKELDDLLNRLVKDWEDL